MALPSTKLGQSLDFSSNVHVELRALKDGLILALDLGIPYLEIEIDSLTVVEHIKNNQTTYCFFEIFFVDNYRYLDRDWVCTDCLFSRKQLYCNTTWYTDQYDIYTWLVESILENETKNKAVFSNGYKLKNRVNFPCLFSKLLHAWLLANLLLMGSSAWFKESSFIYLVVRFERFNIHHTYKEADSCADILANASCVQQMDFVC